MKTHSGLSTHLAHLRLSLASGPVCSILRARASRLLFGLIALGAAGPTTCLLAIHGLSRGAASLWQQDRARAAPAASRRVPCSYSFSHPHPAIAKAQRIHKGSHKSTNKKLA